MAISLLPPFSHASAEWAEMHSPGVFEALRQCRSKGNPDHRVRSFVRLSLLSWWRKCLAENHG